MPNHVTTRCIVSGPREDIAKFIETCIRDDDSRPPKPHLDFDTVIPMPESVKGTESGSNADLGFEILTGAAKPSRLGLSMSFLSYPWIKEMGITNQAQLRTWAEKERPEAIASGEKALAAYKETGFHDWYDWSIANWGTKWNSYDFTGSTYDATTGTDDSWEFRFDTAWSFPTPIFKKLVEMFSRLTFDCACFDEGWNFAGKGCFNGQPPFRECDATAELYELVHGKPPVRDEDEDEE